MFENLDVYQKAVDFADQISALTGEFPRDYRFLATMADCVDCYAAAEHEVGVAVFSVGQARLVGKTGCPSGSPDCDVVFGVAWHGE
ncbi:MAG: hypothetical protein R6X33_09210 [Candidatus Brocadiia bacterium]